MNELENNNNLDLNALDENKDKYAVLKQKERDTSKRIGDKLSDMINGFFSSINSTFNDAQDSIDRSINESIDSYSNNGNNNFPITEKQVTPYDYSQEEHLNTLLNYNKVTYSLDDINHNNDNN